MFKIIYVVLFLIILFFIVFSDFLMNGFFESRLRHWILWSYDITVTGDANRCDLDIRAELFGVIPFSFYNMNFSETFSKGSSTSYEEYDTTKVIEHTIQCSENLSIEKRIFDNNHTEHYPALYFSYKNPGYFRARSIQGFLNASSDIVFNCDNDKDFILIDGDIDDYSELKEFEFHCTGYKSYK